MPRDYSVYLEDICDAIAKIRRYTEGLSAASLAEDELRLDAVLRNLEVIGEAVKAIPETVRVSHPEVEWRKIAGLRDLLIHRYFGIDLEIIWDIVENKLPKLASSIERMISDC